MFWLCSSSRGSVGEREHGPGGVGWEGGCWFRANAARPVMCPVLLCSTVFLNVLPVALLGLLQAEKVLLFSQDTNLTALLLEAKDLEARVIILSARSVPRWGAFM